MKKKRKSPRGKTTNTFLVLLALSYFLISSPSLADVYTVSNAPTPMLGQFNMELQIDTVFDSLKAPPFLDVFYIGDFAVDSFGNIFLLTNRSVIKCSKSGDYIRHYPIRIGQGPGEFNDHVRHVYSDRNDKVYVEDNSKLVVLSNDLVFEKNVPASPTNNPICFDNNSNIYCLKDKYGPTGINKTLYKFDPSGQVKSIFASFLEGGYQKQGGLTMASRHEYKPKAYYCIHSNFLYYSYNFDYAINRYDMDGQLSARFLVDERPIKMSDEEKAYIVKRHKKQIRANIPLNIPMDFPNNRPFSSGLLCDEKGRLYLVKFKSVLDNTEDFILFIFSNKGRLLYSSRIPYFPKIISNGVIYALDTYRLDEGADLSYRIIGLTIKNYDRMKSDI
jgi:hypothetical protein